MVCVALWFVGVAISSASRNTNVIGSKILKLAQIEDEDEVMYIVTEYNVFNIIQVVPLLMVPERIARLLLFEVRTHTHTYINT